MLIKTAMKFYLITVHMAEQVTTDAGADVGGKASLALLVGL